MFANHRRGMRWATIVVGVGLVLALAACKDGGSSSSTSAKPISPGAATGTGATESGSPAPSSKPLTTTIKPPVSPTEITPGPVGQDGDRADSSPAGNQPAVLDCGGGAYVQPDTIRLTCADANSSLSGLTWASWTDQSAQGVGVQHVNTCTPSCADGQHRDIPVTVLVTTVNASGNFTRITITGPDGVATMQALA